MFWRSLLRVACLCFLLVIILTSLSSTAVAGVRLGGVVVSGGYAHYGWPYYGGYPYYGGFPYGGWYPYGWGYWPGTYWTGPVYGPYAIAPYAFTPAPNKGEVKLKSPAKDAKVYLDGGYAGTADKLKTMWLDPGAYDIELRIEGKEPLQRRIYVLSGKTLNLDFREEQP